VLFHLSARILLTALLKAGQFYYASWWFQQVGTVPSPHDIRSMLGDICSNSDADISFDKMTFTITGSDDAVKSALTVLSQIKFVTMGGQQIRVKIELANEHKEFVSGKKNGKINKIMTQSVFSKSTNLHINHCS
jgi:hypothetical protein